MQGEKLRLFGCVLLFLIAYLPPITHTCLCLLLGSAFKCPEPPSCCESGQYALDECGCCMKCAKAELQKCGGASDISGRCGDGLQCLKTCLPCKTVGDTGLPCIFPFVYQNQTYNKCTPRDSDNGQPWCATAVDETGHVIDFAWGDCSEGCPGTRVECDDRYFSIEEGTCIDVTVPGAIPNWFGAPAVRLDPPTEVLIPAPVCKHKSTRREYENTCRCDRGETALDFDTQGQPRGNCTGLDENEEDNLDKVWCFLENIRDPQDPKSGCYSDTTWSARDGRYWSALACTQDPDVNSSQDLETDTQANFQQRSNFPQARSQPIPGPTRPPPTTTTTSTTTTFTPITSSNEIKDEFSERPRTSPDLHSRPRVRLDYGYRDEDVYNYDSADYFDYEVDYNKQLDDYSQLLDEDYTTQSSVFPQSDASDTVRPVTELKLHTPEHSSQSEERARIRPTTLKFTFEDNLREQEDNTESYVFIPEPSTGNI